MQFSPAVVLAISRGTARIPDPRSRHGEAKPRRNDHKARQTRPIQLGVSGGNASDTANGFCCSGTLGALVTARPARQYILSNTHVFAGDVGRRWQRQGQQPSATTSTRPGSSTSAARSSPPTWSPICRDWASFGAVQCRRGDRAKCARVRSARTARSSRSARSPTPPPRRSSARRSRRAAAPPASPAARSAASNATITVGYTDECAGNSFTVQPTPARS